MLQGLTPDAIANNLGHKNSIAATNYAHSVRVLLGQASIHPHRGDSQPAYHAAKRFLKGPLLPESRVYLNGVVADYDPDKTAPHIGPHNWPEALAVSGVYAYSYPHYIRNAYSPSDGRTLIKVGYSTAVGKRLEYQSEQTGVPEDLQLLRVYETDQPKEIEEKFHATLNSLGHNFENATGGNEWFLTNTQTLDAIAAALGLRASDLGAVG